MLPKPVQRGSARTREAHVGYGSGTETSVKSMAGLHSKRAALPMLLLRTEIRPDRMEIQQEYRFTGQLGSRKPVCVLTGQSGPEFCGFLPRLQHTQARHDFQGCR